MSELNMYPEVLGHFSQTYKSRSVSKFPISDRNNVENGGKVILPQSALVKMMVLNVQYPMLFKLTNLRNNRITHCGVLEFVADEGNVYLPQWMMRNLLLEEEEDSILIENVSLPVATFSRFQPQSTEFLEISNPKAVLEHDLRYFACLTSGDVIAIEYNQRLYELRVLETKPANAVSIIECDMNVEFAPPVGYVEPEPKNPEEELEVCPEPSGFVAFCGEGNSLGGKAKKETESSSKAVLKVAYQRGIPNLDYKIGTLRFIRKSRPPPNENKETTKFKVFSGEGFALRKANP